MRLGVKFYCPEWIGDQIFTLNDKEERFTGSPEISKQYVEPGENCGFNESALHIEDDTDIRGFFQSYKYFDEKLVRDWYGFRKEKIFYAEKKYNHIDFTKSVGLHLRYGDKVDLLQYPVFGPKYYNRALKKCRFKQNILIFSDEAEKAKKCLKNLRGNVIYIEDNKPFEDLYLMSLCHDFVCSSSTISWWGAWLNKYADKTIVVPREWFRPGYGTKNTDLTCDGWTELKTCRYLLDSYPVKHWQQKIKEYFH